MLTIPYRRVSFRSESSPKEIERRLNRVTRKHHWGVWSQADARFVGSVRENGFRLMYVPAGRNSYAPWLVGVVLPDREGSAIDIRMMIHPGAALGMLALALAPTYWWVKHGELLSLLWLLAMAGFHAVMYYIGFEPDAVDAESFLWELAA